MKTRLKIFALLAVISSITAKAQDTKSNEFPISYRLQVGVTESKIAKFGNGSFHTGFVLGAQLDLPFESDFFFRPGFRFVNRGENNVTYKNKKANVSATYISMPVLVGMNISIDDKSKIYITAGPEFAYGIAGSVDELKLFNGSTEKPFNSFECGLSGSLGYEYNRFFVEGVLELGLTSPRNNKYTDSSSLFPISNNHNFFGTAMLLVGYKF